MRLYDYAQAKQQFAGMFDAALTEEVIIKLNNGNRFKIVPINDEIETRESPLEHIKGINAKVTTQELVDIIRESRAGK